METAPPNHAISLSLLRKSYGRKVAVRELSLTVPRGELFAFLGPNGAGKTTTIKLIVGLLRPDEGTVHVCGHRVHADGLEAKAKLAYVPDQPFMYEKLTGREFLHSSRRCTGWSPRGGMRFWQDWCRGWRWRSFWTR